VRCLSSPGDKEASVKNPSKAFAGATQIAGPSEGGSFDGTSPVTDSLSLARAAHIDLRALGMPHVNLLLIGAEGVINNFLETLLMDLREPITHWCAGEPLVLPPVGRTGTVILHEVGALPLDDQRRLLRWLEIALGRMQVVSTTSASLLTRVQAGTFVDTLYYRLNTVCLDVTA
jgi:hypothetical protein